MEWFKEVVLEMVLSNPDAAQAFASYVLEPDFAFTVLEHLRKRGGHICRFGHGSTSPICSFFRRLPSHLRVVVWRKAVELSPWQKTSNVLAPASAHSAGADLGSVCLLSRRSS